MSNDKGLELSIKEFATQRGKTVQAVYQQMKRKENAEALEGHVFTKRVGNKDVRFLDAEAISILDEGSVTTQSVVVQDDLRNELATVKQQAEEAKNQILYQAGQINTLRELLAEKEQKLLALAEPQSKIEALEAQNRDLSDEIREKDELLAEEKKNAQNALNELTEKAQEELKEIREAFQSGLQERDQKIRELENRTFGDYLKTLFRKKRKE